MRILVILGLVQTVLLVFLVAKTLGLNVVRESGHSPNNHLPDQMLSDLPKQFPRAWQHDIRQILRDELEIALIQTKFSEPIDKSERVVGTAKADTRSNLDYRTERQQTMAQIEYFRSVGRISEPEMARLQMDMARLRARDRSLALRTLAKALSSGEIDGRF